MREDPEGLVRSIYDALAERDFEEVLDRLALHVEVRLPDSLPFGGIYQGREQVEHLARMLRDRFAELAVEPERVLRADPFVIVLGRHAGRSRDGDDFDVPSVGVWRVENGLVDLYKDFTDTAAIVRAMEGSPVSPPPSA